MAPKPTLVYRRFSANWTTIALTRIYSFEPIIFNMSSISAGAFGHDWAMAPKPTLQVYRRFSTDLKRTSLLPSGALNFAAITSSVFTARNVWCLATAAATQFRATVLKLCRRISPAPVAVRRASVKSPNTQDAHRLARVCRTVRYRSTHTQPAGLAAALNRCAPQERWRQSEMAASWHINATGAPVRTLLPRQLTLLSSVASQCVNSRYCNRPSDPSHPTRDHPAIGSSNRNVLWTCGLSNEPACQLPHFGIKNDQLRSDFTIS